MSNNWKEIRRFYKIRVPRILAEKKNEWAIDPYAWEAQANINMTPIEAWLWHDIRECDAVLYPQYPVLGFFVDFANPRAKVAIECDGRDYHTDKQKDADRDAMLVAEGWTVYRFTGAECMEGVYSDLRNTYKKLKSICELHGILRK